MGIIVAGNVSNRDEQDKLNPMISSHYTGSIVFRRTNKSCKSYLMLCWTQKEEKYDFNVAADVSVGSVLCVEIHVCLDVIASF